MLCTWPKKNICMVYLLGTNYCGIKHFFAFSCGDVILSLIFGGQCVNKAGSLHVSQGLIQMR